MTHHERILRHLKEIGGITSWEAIMEYGNTRLSATIHKLRKDGYNISSKAERAKNRYGEQVHFVRYILEDKK